MVRHVLPEPLLPPLPLTNNPTPPVGHARREARRSRAQASWRSLADEPGTSTTGATQQATLAPADNDDFTQLDDFRSPQPADYPTAWRILDRGLRCCFFRCAALVSGAASLLLLPR